MYKQKVKMRCLSTVNVLKNECGMVMDIEKK
jgi:hypothetical protein